MDDIEIKMPNEWAPRDYQLPALQALDEGCKRAILLWHRRAGKDATALNWVATRMCREPTSVLYMLPEFGQAKRILFRELNSAGQTYLDQAFPEAIRAGKPNTQEGFMRLWNGSVFQAGGFDSIDRYIGAGPKIVVMSEYATSPHAERAWQLLLPILINNGGYALFPYTPRGNNHGKDLWDMAQGNQQWFTSKLTCEQTGIVVDGMPLPDAVRRDVVAGEIDEPFSRQEFWCSWEAPNSGSYYGRLLEQAEQQGRVTAIPWDPALPVYTWWDIGWGDATAIWFAQATRGGEIRLIDYYESEGQGLSHYIGVLNDRRAGGWTFDPRGQLVPHDFAAHHFTTGTSAEQAARDMGWRMTIVPAMSLHDSIDAVRRVIPRCWFDATKCEVGLKRLRQYTKKWSAQLQRFTEPLHDVNSNGADAFRTGVNGMRMAGMHLPPNISQAVRDGDRAMFRSTAPVVAPMGFSVWGKRR